MSSRLSHSTIRAGKLYSTATQLWESVPGAAAARSVSLAAGGDSCTYARDTLLAILATSRQRLKAVVARLLRTGYGLSARAAKSAAEVPLRGLQRLQEQQRHGDSLPRQAPRRSHPLLPSIRQLLTLYVAAAGSSASRPDARGSTDVDAASDSDSSDYDVSLDEVGVEDDPDLDESSSSLKAPAASAASDVDFSCVPGLPTSPLTAGIYAYFRLRQLSSMTSGFNGRPSGRSAVGMPRFRTTTPGLFPCGSGHAKALLERAGIGFVPRSDSESGCTSSSSRLAQPVYGPCALLSFVASLPSHEHVAVPCQLPADKDSDHCDVYSMVRRASTWPSVVYTDGVRLHLPLTTLTAQVLAPPQRPVACDPPDDRDDTLDPLGNSVQASRHFHTCGRVQVPVQRTKWLEGSVDFPSSLSIPFDACVPGCYALEAAGNFNAAVSPFAVVDPGEVAGFTALAVNPGAGGGGASGTAADDAAVTVLVLTPAGYRSMVPSGSRTTADNAKWETQLAAAAEAKAAVQARKAAGEGAAGVAVPSKLDVKRPRLAQRRVIPVAVAASEAALSVAATRDHGTIRGFLSFIGVLMKVRATAVLTTDVPASAAFAFRRCVQLEVLNPQPACASRRRCACARLVCTGRSGPRCLTITARAHS